MNKTIWITWFQGWEDCPPLCKYCLDSWKYYNPDWKIVTLDENNYRDYVDIDSVLPELDTNRTAFSDILRMFILKQYGGVWVDATLFCNKPLSEWIDSDTNFFVFSRSDIMISSWFIYSDKEGHVINKWYDAVVQYWKERANGVDKFDGAYIWVHNLFVELYNTDALFAEEIDNMEKIDCYPHPTERGNGPHMFTPYHIYMGEKINRTIVDRIDSGVDPCYKLTYKIPPIDIRGTNIEYLIKGIYGT